MINLCTSIYFSKNGIDENQVQNEKSLKMKIRCSKRRNPALLLLLFIMSVVSNLGSLVHPLQPELRKQVRDLEKVSLRRCKSDCNLLFNSVCVKENLLPNYSNIYIYILLHLPQLFDTMMYVIYHNIR